MKMRHLLVPALVLALPVAVSAQARVVVNVQGFSGDRLSGARVTVLHESDGGIVGECLTVGSAGCAVTVAPFRRYIVRAAIPGYIPFPDQVVVETTAGDNGVGLTLAPPVPMTEPDSTNTTIVHGVISGMVRSLADEPVAGVMVVALLDGLFRGTQSTTGEDGSFRMSVAPGTYTVRSRSMVSTRTEQVIEGAAYGAPLTVASGHVTGPVMLYAGSFKLPTVTVTMITAAGRPVVGASVINAGRWRSSTGTEHFMNGQSATGRNGIVAIPAALPGAMTITATATVDGELLAGMTIADVGSKPLDLVMTLGPAAQLTGRVEFTGLPRPLHAAGGLRVFTDPGPAVSSYSAADTNGLVGADGEFVVKGLVGERCLLLRNVPYGWRLAEVTHYGRPLDDKPLLFQPGEKISGIVFRVEPTTIDPSSLPPVPPCPVTRQGR